MSRDLAINTSVSPERNVPHLGYYSTAHVMYLPLLLQLPLRLSKWEQVSILQTKLETHVLLLRKKIAFEKMSLNNDIKYLFLFFHVL